MASLDRIAYLVRAKAPWIYQSLEGAARGATALLYGQRIRRALAVSEIQGNVYGAPAVIRTIGPDDTDALVQMLAGMSDEHLTFFHPHALDPASLRRVLSRKTVMTYGLYVDGRLCGYGLLKLFPTRKAYRGRLIAPEFAGRGVGKFLSRYLDWQVALLGFQPCATIHRDNLASLKSLAAGRPFRVVSELPNGFQLIAFDMETSHVTRPELLVPAVDEAVHESAGA